MACDFCSQKEKSLCDYCKDFLSVFQEIPKQCRLINIASGEDVDINTFNQNDYTRTKTKEPELILCR